MSVPTESITQERLKRWARRLAAEHSTPLVLLGIGHDSKKGQITVLTVEEINDEFLAGSLAFALEQLKPGMVLKKHIPGQPPGTCVQRDKPTTPEQCALIALAEYQYWTSQERTDETIPGMAAAANIYAAITLGQMAPWHPQ